MSRERGDRHRLRVRQTRVRLNAREITAAFNREGSHARGGFSSQKPLQAPFAPTCWSSKPRKLAKNRSFPHLRCLDFDLKLTSCVHNHSRSSHVLVAHRRSRPSIFRVASIT